MLRGPNLCLGCSVLDRRLATDLLIGGSIQRGGVISLFDRTAMREQTLSVGEHTRAPLSWDAQVDSTHGRPYMNGWSEPFCLVI